MRALLYGWGFIATTGFGLPAPIIPSLLFTDKTYWLDTAIYPLVFWITIFVLDEVYIFRQEVKLREQAKRKGAA